MRPCPQIAQLLWQTANGVRSPDNDEHPRGWMEDGSLWNTPSGLVAKKWEQVPPLWRLSSLCKTPGNWMNRMDYGIVQAQGIYFNYFIKTGKMMGQKQQKWRQKSRGDICDSLRVLWAIAVPQRWRHRIFGGANGACESGSSCRSQGAPAGRSQDVACCTERKSRGRCGNWRNLNK